MHRLKKAFLSDNFFSTEAPLLGFHRQHCRPPILDYFCAVDYLRLPKFSLTNSCISGKIPKFSLTAVNIKWKWDDWWSGTCFLKPIHFLQPLSEGRGTRLPNLNYSETSKRVQVSIKSMALIALWPWGFNLSKNGFIHCIKGKGEVAYWNSCLVKQLWLASQQLAWEWSCQQLA